MDPFNGDTYLAEEFIRLRDRFAVKTVVETGTYYGDTTKWLSENFNNVITLEIDKKCFRKAQETLAGRQNVSLINGDSSTDLLPVLRSAVGPLLVFLDAHWYANPLMKELQQIQEAGLRPILAIHDFRVPDRPEFGYDTYPREGIVYEWDWIRERISEVYGQFDYYYNRQAVGMKRGCLFIVPR